MSLFDVAGGFMDEIRCDEPSYLIWKWHPAGSQKGANRREDAIRWGSSLRVRDGSVAVFVYNQKDGAYQDFIEGPYDQVLKTANLPVLASVIGLAYDGGTPFQAEVYFINLAQVVQIRFGVPFFDVYDPRFLDFGVPIAVRGTLTFHIKDYRQFIKLHRLDEFNLDDFKSQVKDAVARYIKSVVANAPAEFGVPVVQIERNLAKIHDIVEPALVEQLSARFGVEVSAVDIAALEVDKTSEGYAKLAAVTRDIEERTVRAQAEVNIKNLHDQQRINAENLEETLRIQRKEAQYAQRKRTQTSNFGAYQLEQQAAVGIAGAEALGQMGANGAMDMGAGGGGGMDPAAMMAGMAMGGAIGQNMAGMMGGMMGGLGQTPQAGASVPPPVPTSAYHLAVNGVATGPFSLAELGMMVQAGALVQDSLVWKPGMGDWRHASDVEELAAVLGMGGGTTPPSVPSVAE